MSTEPQATSISDQDTQKEAIISTPLPQPDDNGRIVLHQGLHFVVTTTSSKEKAKHYLKKVADITMRQPHVMPHQEERMALLATHQMPIVTPINPLPKRRIPLPLWLETAIVGLGLMVALIVHVINMFNFPRYELDEGTYISSAWSITQGMIQPYAYGYGHPPLAWIQIAGLIQLLGGFFTFGNALNTGRVVMLFYALGGSLLVYLIVRRLSGSRSAGLLSLILYSLSPLGISFQRQILLDNIATFWLLVSLYFLVNGNSRLRNTVYAAISLGIAILSKEVLILFVPGMIYAVWLHTTHFQRKFALVSFSYIVLAICSGFVLMAVLKGELIPYDIRFPGSTQVWHLPWDTHDHLSMLGTFFQQAQRGSNEGSLQDNFYNWWTGDQLIVICSIIPVVCNIVIGWWHRRNLLVGLLAASFWLLLLRGGVVLAFYFIPLIPLSAINAALTLTTIAQWLQKLTRLEAIRAILLCAAISMVAPYDLAQSSELFTQHPTSAQTDAMTWIRNNVPNSSFIVINSYLYMDLRVAGGAGVSNGAIYPYAHIYFNVASDPEIYDKILQNNWDRIDYIVADSEMLTDINNNAAPDMKIIKDALNHSFVRAQFSAQDHASNIVIQVYEVRHKLANPIIQVPKQPELETFIDEKRAFKFM